jgi:hypothetical protein
MPVALHAILRRSAAALGLSLNDYCVRKLAAPLGELSAFGCFPEVVRRAATVCGSGLVGVMVYGSWTRGESRADSDVDVLIVVEPDFPLTRELYRRWDAAPPLRWEGRSIEPQIVRLPAAMEAAGSGLWAEVAIDGVTLFMRDPALAEVLRRVRREIACGLLVRRVVQGQPYWVRAA